MRAFLFYDVASCVSLWKMKAANVVTAIAPSGTVRQRTVIRLSTESVELCAIDCGLSNPNATNPKIANHTNDKMIFDEVFIIEIVFFVCLCFYKGNCVKMYKKPYCFLK